MKKDKYVIQPEQLHPEVRATGTLIRNILPYFKESTFRKGNWFMDHFMKGVWLGKGTKRKTVYIRRKDKSKLRILVCTPRNPVKNVPGVLWIHGGGYGLGLPEQECFTVSKLISAVNAVFVLPDYTRSTEAPYPAALHDCYLTLKWMKKHGSEYGINDSQLFVGGESAGGGLCAAVTLLARDRGEIAVAYQMPLYPMLDDRMITISSQNNDAPVWNTKSNITGWKMYLGERYGTDQVPAYAAPARADDYKGLPPTLTYVGTVEPFHDETVEYINKLKEADVPVHFMEFQGCFHAFNKLCGNSSVGRRAVRFLTGGFQYAAEHYFAEQSDNL